MVTGGTGGIGKATALGLADLRARVRITGGDVHRARRPQSLDMVIQVDGNNLPGLRCNPGPQAVPNENIHVGIGQRFGSDQLFPGDATSASWRFDVRVIPIGEDSFDFRGALVSGKRGDRFLYLNWGSVSEDGAFHPFRRAKVDLTAIDSALVARALEADAELHCTVELTDAKGNPTCARFRGELISWRIVERMAPAS